MLLITLAVVTFGGFIALSYRRGWQWTGLPASPATGESQTRAAKSLWDWLALLVIPVSLALLAFLLNDAHSRRDQQGEDRRAAQQRALAADADAESTLRNYLTQMSQLMLDRKLLRSKPGADVRSVARTATLTAVRRVGGERRGVIVRFLSEARLLRPESQAGGTIAYVGERAVVVLSSAELARSDLAGADLPWADFTATDLRGANLSGAELFSGRLVATNLSHANLDHASLFRANLRGANLRGASLRGARLSETILVSAKLANADLSRADLERTDLSSGSLQGANLSSANLAGANLRGAYLSNADMNRASVAGADLRGARGANLRGTRGTPAYGP